MVKTGIYSITNLINNKKYIGQSVHIYKRWGVHKNPHNWTNTALCRAFKKYGIDNFKFEIIEECSPNLLNEREIYWISYYNSFEDGYNLTTGGDNGSHCIKLSPQLVRELINDLLYSNLTGIELAAKYKVNNDTISHINNGKSWRQNNITYPIRKYSKKMFYCLKCGTQITPKAKYCKSCNLEIVRMNNSIQLTAYELAKLIYETNVSTVARMFNLSYNGVIRTCKRLGLPIHIKEIKQWFLNNNFHNSLTG